MTSFNRDQASAGVSRSRWKHGLLRWSVLLGHLQRRGRHGKHLLLCDLPFLPFHPFAFMRIRTSLAFQWWVPLSLVLSMTADQIASHAAGRRLLLTGLQRVICCYAGPSGSAGYCSEQCCSASTSVCVVSDNSDGLGFEACCAHRASCAAHSRGAGVACLMFTRTNHLLAVVARTNAPGRPHRTHASELTRQLSVFKTSGRSDSRSGPARPGNCFPCRSYRQHRLLRWSVLRGRVQQRVLRLRRLRRLLCDLRSGLSWVFSKA